MGEAESSNSDEDPGIATVFDYLLYSVSLPERTLRATSAMVGGALRESTELLVPQAFRSSRSYSIFVQQGLDFLAENVGGVQAPAESDSAQPSVTQVKGYVARKAVGNFVELAGLATLHVSPLTVLAVLSDLAYGSNFYLQELSRELKREGIIGEESTIDSTTDLLQALSNAAGVTAETFDLPPMSVEGFRETISQTQEALAQIDPSDLLPRHEVTRLWTEMQAEANREGVSLFEVSSAMSLYMLNRVTTAGQGALSTIRVAGNLFDQHVLDFYGAGLVDIRQQGLYRSLAESSRPYLGAVWENFQSERATLTEDVLSGKWVGRIWQGMQTWMRSQPASTEDRGNDPAS